MRLITYRCDRCGKILHVEPKQYENLRVFIKDVEEKDVDLCEDCHASITLTLDRKYAKRIDKAIDQILDDEQQETE